MKELLATGLLVLLAGGATMVLGPEFVEDEIDAGSTPDTAKDTVGAGVLSSIAGALTGTPVSAGEGDFEDMYLVQIADPLTFIATTIEMGGFTEFDSAIYIFDENGLGILGNDNGAGAAAQGDEFGACCASDGTCLDNVSSFDCEVTFNGEFQGQGTTCSEVTCPPTGSCCLIAAGAGSCFELIESACVSLGGFYNGDGTFCDKTSCFGACCLPDDSCQETSFGDCVIEFSGSFQGGGTFCESVFCGEPTGACCLTSGDECIDDVTAIDCAEFDGEYQGDGTSCVDITCGTPTGACCFGDEFCIDGETEDSCTGEGGLYQGDGTFCESIECGGGSTVGNQSNDGSGAEITTPGLYYVAICVASRRPVSDGGEIFDIQSPSEISGPDGPGGGQPITGWIQLVNAGSNPGPVNPGQYLIAMNGVAFAGPDVTFAFRSKDGCPQQLKRQGNKKIKSYIAGNADLGFDVQDIDLDTILLSRVDGVGTPVPPHDKGPGPKFKIKDKVGPFDSGGDPCNCDPDKHKDGVDDLRIPFKTQEIVEGLELEGLPDGTVIEIVISGNLLDGSPFAGTDCIELVGGASPMGNLVVSSNNAAGYVDIVEFDFYSDQGGYTNVPFDRHYEVGSLVTTSAESWMDGRPLIGWRLNGSWLRKYRVLPPEVSMPTQSITIMIESGPQTLEAIYGAAAGPGPGAGR